MKKIIFLILMLFSQHAYVQEPGSGYNLNFDGINDFVSVPKVNLFTGLTYSAWIQTTSTDAISGFASNSALSIIGENTPSIWNSFGINGGKVRYIHYTGSYENVTGATSVNDGNWHHVAVTHDQSTNAVVIYVDGIADATGSLTYGGGGGATSVGFTRIGGSYLDGTGTQDFFDGNIDEVVIFNTPISQTEIRDWMCKKITNLHSAYANLIAYYNFDENSGTTLTDLKGANNGTLINEIDYEQSGAPIGDQSVYQYSSTPSISLVDSEGDSLTINSFTGMPTGAYIYKVDTAPNTLIGSQGVGTNDKYFGVFKIGDNSATYTAAYDYSSNPDVGSNESDLKLYSRNDNASTWLDAAATLDMGADTLTVIGQNTEYILGSSGIPLPVELINFHVD